MAQHIHPFVDRQLKNKRIELKKRLWIVLVCAVLFGLLCCLLAACNLPLPGGSSDNTATPTPGITPIVSTYQRSRLVSVLIDTPPFMQATYYKEALNSVADRVLEQTTVCQGGLTVFVSFLGHDSVHTKVMSITVPPLPCDEAKPTLQPLPDPKKFTNQYDYIDALNKVNTANDGLIAAWQANLNANHHLLADTRAKVLQDVNALKTQPVIVDASGADLYGGLFLAAQEIQNSNAVKSLVIASQLINNTLLNAAPINLSGFSRVNVIYHSCETLSASDCLANDAKFKQTLVSFGVKMDAIHFYTPGQTSAWYITF